MTEVFSYRVLYVVGKNVFAEMLRKGCSGLGSVVGWNFRTVCSDVKKHSNEERTPAYPVFMEYGLKEWQVVS